MSPPSTTDDSEPQTSQSRRRFLLGLGAATAAVAGCTSQSDTNSDGPAEHPTTEPFDPASDLSYGKWLTTADDGLLFASADLEAIPTDSEATTSGEEFPEDPLIAYPFLLGYTAIGLGQLQLSFAGLNNAITPESAREPTIENVTVVNETVVGKGSFTADELDELLTTSTAEPYGSVYEQTNSTLGYDMYEPVEVSESISEDPPLVALTDESVVVSPNDKQLTRTVATGAGNRSHIYETNEVIAGLLAEAGTGDVVIGELGSLRDGSRNLRETFGVDPQFEVRADEDVVASLELTDGSDTVKSQFALTAEGLDESRREAINTTFGAAAVDSSVTTTVNDGPITASGTYNADILEPDGTEEANDQESSATAPRELVSPDALALQYEPLREQQLNELWVTVTEDTEAAGIRVEAASGSSTELRPQDRPVSADDSVAVQVEPDKDSITVSVFNDDGQVSELMTESVPTDELSKTAARQAVPEEALSYSYESPTAGDFGSLTVEVVADIEAETLVAQPQEAPGLFSTRVGSITNDEPVGTGTTLETAVDPDGDEVIVYATVDGATGEVARWRGPD